MGGANVFGEERVVRVSGDARLVIAKEHEHDGAVEITKLLHEPLEVAVRGVDAGEVLVELTRERGVILREREGVARKKRLVDVVLVVAAVVLHGDVEDELRGLVAAEAVEHALVGRGVCDAGVESGRAREVLRGEEAVEPEGPVDDVALPVRGGAGVDRRRVISHVGELGDEVVDIAEVIERVRVLGVADVA